MELVIFDLDDTLIDFAATRRVAHERLATVLEREGVDSAAFLQALPGIDRPLYALFEQRKLSRDAYRMRRFSEPLALLGLTPKTELVTHLNQVFMDCVNDTPLLFDDARPVLAALRRMGIRTAILTNGPSDGQRRKLQATGLDGAVDHVAIGEEIGFSKPSASAFHAVVKRFSLDGSKVMMVGDSPELDYDGALTAGLRALLLDRAQRYRDGGRASIGSLHALLTEHAGT